MAKGGKLGTMGGVYTPSVLTILGVIMYMRLSWVVGNAGTLFTAFIIILLAHVVSITTGLSVSSIATDKKIKGGGIYYMLSRSLGFPIGGAIGVTIFVATALSIALYLIGFSESALVVLQPYLGIEEITVNHLRIAGSIALLCIGTIAYISTSVAIKTQYIILALIGLSLLSVFLGTSDGKGFDTSVISANAEMVPFATLFGIFFPAVTGFTAGVAMSGDLRNPKRAIPWGTMLAIGTGLIVYSALTLFVYYRIPLAELRSNTNVLVEFSWIPQFVIAGIWGATLSSALGGILGAPRILQAMSLDRITPRFFAKGKGKNNEPHRALFLTFLLAEAGILIGELDVIAGIVAMFYMAAYLFINVSCFLEQWASPDFRPTFRIPLLISLIGTVVTFLLMIQLDIIAAIVSVIVMGIIFLWLTRKQLELGSGDVWQSVWSSVVKLGLKKLTTKSVHERNWEPNILLFSGGTNQRPHLLELSKAIAGRNGMISNFDLVENESAEMLFPKSKQSIKVADDEDGSIFYRRQECKHIFEGIATIAQTYGFSGVEPNTVLLGWVHITKKPKEFHKLNNFLHELDYNILYLDYDIRKGFGKKQKIDIWWRDLSRVSYFTVQLCKFLMASRDWNGAEVRFLYLNNNNAAQHAIRRVMEEITQEIKDLISIEIVNNEVEKRPFYDVVRVFSQEADLIVMDLPKLGENKDEDFIKRTNKLLEEMGTTLLIRPSSKFDKGTIVNIEMEKEFNSPLENGRLVSRDTVPELAVSNFASLQKRVETFDKRLLEANEKLVNQAFEPIQRIFTVLADHIGNHETIDNAFFEEIKSVLVDIQKNRLESIEQNMAFALRSHEGKVKDAIEKLPSKLKRAYSREELQEKDEDILRIVRLKEAIQKWRNKTDKVKLRAIAEKEYKFYYKNYLTEKINRLGLVALEANLLIKRRADRWNIAEGEETEKEMLQKMKASLHVLLESAKLQIFEELNWLSRMLSNSIMAESDKLLLVGLTFAKDKNNAPPKQYSSIARYPSNWRENTYRLLNHLHVELGLFRIKKTLIPQINEVYSVVEDAYLQKMQELVKQLKKEDGKVTVKQLEEYENALIDLGMSLRRDKLLQNISYTSEKQVQKLSEESEVLSQHDLNEFGVNQIDLKSEYIDVKKVVGYLLDNDVIHKINNLIHRYFTEIQAEQLKLENAIKLRQFSMSEENLTENSVATIAGKTVQEFENIEENMHEVARRLEKELQRICSKCNELLTTEVIWGRAEYLNGIIRKEKAKRGLEKYVYNIKRLPKMFSGFMHHLLLKVKDIVTKTTYQQRFSELENPHSTWRDFVDKISLSFESQANIPFYYQQLFVGKHKAPATPLQERSHEWNRFRTAYSRFKDGESGAIAITGEYFSGASYLVDNILSVYNFERVYFLEPPAFLFNDSKMTLERAFKVATAKNVSLDTILQQLPNHTVFVIENLELWWTRTQKGNRLIDELCSLINKYSQKFLFIFSCNIEFFRLIRKTTAIDTCLQETIKMQPLGIEKVRDSILNRQYASGIAYVWHGKEGDELSKRAQNQMMQGIVGLAQGNIGFAYYLWLNSIRSMEDGKVYLENNTTRNLPEVNMPEWDNMLLQILLHKMLSKRSLYLIYQDVPRKEIDTVITSLLRTRVVLEAEPNVYKINPFVMVYVIKYLRNGKYIS